MKPKLREVLARLAANPAELVKHAPQTCSASMVTELGELRAGGVAISPEKRDELLQRCAAGQHVEIEIDLLAYEQKPNARNRNNVRFRDGAMLSLGRSGRGMPFLRDHNKWELDARGGTIIASETEKRGDGDYAVRQTVKLTAPWAVDLALRGLLTSVSIGWRPTGPVLCSACDAPIFEQCWHTPGDRLAEKDLGKAGKKLVRDPKGELVVEWIYTAAELVETSGVNVPGVPAARVEDVRASMFASLSAQNPGLVIEPELEGDEPGKQSDMNPELLKLLGLAATATAEEVLAAVNALQADKATLVIVQKDLDKHAKEIEALNADRRKREEDTFISDALSTGRIAKGDEEHWRALFAADSKRATELMAKREAGSSTPVGLPRQSDNDPAKAPVITGGGPRGRTSMHLVRKQLGKLQAHLASNPRALALAVNMFGFEDREGRCATQMVGVPESVIATLGATGIANNADLEAAKVGFHAAFLEQLTIEDDEALKALFTEAPSNKKIEEWDWMGDLPDMEEWIGERKLAALAGYNMRLANKKWSSGIRVKNDDVKDDNLGLLPPQISALADRARFHRFDLMVKLMLNGFDGASFPEVGDGLAYDDAFFFANAHRGGNDNKLTVALDSTGLSAARLKMRRMRTYDGVVPFRCRPSHLVVGPKNEEMADTLTTADEIGGEKNPHKGKYKVLVSDLIDDDFDDDWFLADLRTSIRPFLLQMREEISSSAITGGQGTNNDSTQRFSFDEMWFGAEARYNVGYFEFRRIVGSRP